MRAANHAREEMPMAQSGAIDSPVRPRSPPARKSRKVRLQTLDGHESGEMRQPAQMRVRRAAAALVPQAGQTHQSTRSRRSRSGFSPESENTPAGDVDEIALRAASPFGRGPAQFAAGEEIEESPPEIAGENEREGNVTGRPSRARRSAAALTDRAGPSP